MSCYDPYEETVEPEYGDEDYLDKPSAPEEPEGPRAEPLPLEEVPF